MSKPKHTYKTEYIENEDGEKVYRMTETIEVPESMIDEVWREVCEKVMQSVTNQLWYPNHHEEFLRDIPLIPPKQFIAIKGREGTE